MKGPIYLARKDTIYHILRISIHGFTKVLKGVERGKPGKGQDYYLKFCSCFLVNLRILVLHGSRTFTLIRCWLVPAIPSTRHVKVLCRCLWFQGLNPNPNLK
jgi:hypothetical protein